MKPPEDRPEAEVSGIDREALRWLFGFVRPHRAAIGWLLLLSAATSILVLLQPFFTKLVIDEGLLAGRFDTLLLLVAVMFTVGLTATLLSGANRYFYTRLSGKVLFELRESVYRHLQTLSPTFYANNRGGDIMSRLDGDVAEIQRFAIDSLFAAVSSLLGLVGTIGFMLYLNWRLTLLLLAVVPLQWIYLRFMRARVQRHTRRLRERSSDISAFLVETLPAMKFIQGVGAEAREAARLSGLNHHYLDQLLHLQLVQFTTSAVPNTLTSLARAVVLVLGGYWVIQGEMALGSLIAFVTYLGMAVGPVQGLLGLYMSLHRVQVCLQRVRYLVDAPVEVHSGDQPLPERASGELRFEGVSFSYPGSERELIRETSLTLPAGGKIGLQSPSGSGKSTLVDLLMRHYDPDAGLIVLDGVDIRQFRLGDWRRNIGLVSQDLVLFRGSLLDNVRYARPEASKEDVLRALQQARLGGLVERLSAGIESLLGERGVNLSGGERQRVAIARTLLQQPSLVILDEATSAVEEAVEREVLATVDELFPDRTRLLISHRPSALADCGYLLSIDEGRVQLREAFSGASA